MKLKVLFIGLLVVLAVEGVYAYSQSIEEQISELDTTIINREQTVLLIELANNLHILDLTNGLKYATKALTNAQILNSQSLIGESKLILGRYYLLLGFYHGALTETNEALDIFVKTENIPNRILAIKQIGDIYFYAEEFDLAMKYFEECFGYAQFHKDTALMISSLIMKGAVLGNIDKMDSAVKVFDLARIWSQKIQDEEQEALSLYNKADVYLHSGKPGQALTHFYELDQKYAFDNIGYRHRSGLYNSITHANIDLGNIADAEKYSNLAFKKLQQNMRFIDMRDYYTYRFELDTMSKNYKSAISNYLMLIKYNDSISDTRFRNQLANFETLFKFQEKESYIEQLTRDNELKEMELRQRTIVLYGALTLLILLVVLIVQSIISSKKRRKHSDELQSKNLELEKILRELKDTQQQMIQSEKMASLGILTAGVAHEINNPLNFISGGVGILKEILEGMKENHADKELIDSYKEASNIIDLGLDRASTIVKALTTFSRSSSEVKTECCIMELVDNLLLFLKQKIDKDILIIKDLAKVEKVMVYPDKMHQIILNLVDNAIDATREVKEGPKEIRISNEFSDGKLIIRVENTGPAISEEHMQKLFDPFFTTKPPGKGTGLGLSIAYRLVKDHNGAISAENTETGVCFRICIPAEIN